MVWGFPVQRTNAVVNGSHAAVFAAIADDHANLLALIDQIETMMLVREPDRDGIVAALGTLAEMTRAHFDREDALMGDSRLEEFEQHRQDHRHLLKCLTDFTGAIRSGAAPPSVEIALDLDNWLSFHIQRFDAELHAHLAA